MKKFLKTLKRFIPKAIFTALQPYYHYFLAGMGAVWYRFPSRKLYVVGVTGTNGKTTTATLLYKIATELGYKAGLISTVENIIAGEVKLTTHTTPDPISLHKIFRDMVDAGCEYVFMEVSSHAVDQKRVLGVHFIGGVFFNFKHHHFGFYKKFLK